MCPPVRRADTQVGPDTDLLASAVQSPVPGSQESLKSHLFSFKPRSAQKSKQKRAPSFRLAPVVYRLWIWDQSLLLARFDRRLAPNTKPMPKSSIEAGSGTACGDPGVSVPPVEPVQACGSLVLLF